MYNEYTIKVGQDFMDINHNNTTYIVFFRVFFNLFSFEILLNIKKRKILQQKLSLLLSGKI